MERNGGKAIAKALQSNCTLEALDLRGNNIGQNGATAIAAMLQTNATLTTVHLGSNRIGDIGAKAIVTALQTNCTLEKLDLALYGDNIDEATMEQIETLLKENRQRRAKEIAQREKEEPREKELEERRRRQENEQREKREQEQRKKEEQAATEARIKREREMEEARCQQELRQREKDEAERRQREKKVMDERRKAQEEQDRIRLQQQQEREKQEQERMEEQREKDERAAAEGKRKKESKPVESKRPITFNETPLLSHDELLLCLEILSDRRQNARDALKQDLTEKTINALEEIEEAVRRYTEVRDKRLLPTMETLEHAVAETNDGFTERKNSIEVKAQQAAEESAFAKLRQLVKEKEELQKEIDAATASATHQYQEALQSFQNRQAAVGQNTQTNPSLSAPTQNVDTNLSTTAQPLPNGSPL